MGLRPLEPLDVRPLFAGLHAELVRLLESLAPGDWTRPTVAGAWAVRDVAAHLLDGDLRRLSFERDGQALPLPEESVANEADLVAFLNGLNADWVRVARRFSPRVLLGLLKVSGPQVAELFSSLDPDGPAFFSVAWAGEASSKSWFDLGREFTERWHHQQQIREAVGRPGILTPELYRPVLDCFLRALPHRYRTVEAPAGSLAVFTIAGDAGGRWYLHRDAGCWRLVQGETGRRLSETTIPQEIAWRIFTKGISREAALTRVVVEGDREVGLHVLGLLAIIG